MGISPDTCVSGKSPSDLKFIEQVKKVWGVNEISTGTNDVFALMNAGKIKNLFIYGEDPVGCANDKDNVKELLNKSGFKVVQDYFLTETAEMADVVLPASYPFESGGSYANTQKYIVTFENAVYSKLEKRSFAQMIDLMSRFGLKNKFDLTYNITLEIASLLKDSVSSNGVGYKLSVTEEDAKEKMFEHGCDYLTRRFEEYFEKQMEEAKELIEI